MEPLPLRFYRLEFAKRAGWRREEQQRESDRALKADEKEKKREREGRAVDDAVFDAMAIAAIFATDAEIGAFAVEIDAYQSATVAALIENEEQSQRVQKQLRILLDRAYVLPDGRRVFKTEDGTRVFDEHGIEVKDIDPHEIEDSRPYWEQYEVPFKKAFSLTQERRELITFQELADEADAEIAEAKAHGGMTKERLEELRKTLADEAPDAVKLRMAKQAPAPDAEPTALPRQDAAFRSAGKLDMPSL